MPRAKPLKAAETPPAVVDTLPDVPLQTHSPEPDENEQDRLQRLARESRKLLFERHLQQPFHPAELKFKPQTVKGDRCLAIAYIDARCVMDRLDDVCGVDGWEDSYRELPDGSVVCKLTIRTPYGASVSKTDVGNPSEQPDAGDRIKAAFSDSLKRAAVKFGIGRYIYRIPNQWVGYDPVKKRPTETAKLPAFAVPAKNVPEPRPYFDPGDELVEIQPVAAAAAQMNVLKNSGTPSMADPIDPPKGPDKKVEEANKKRLDELITTRTNWWKASLDGCDGAAQMTQLIVENLKDEPLQTKALCWDVIQAYIKEAGMVWNAKRKEVDDPNSVGEAIPF